jgi:hypothetical protein
VNESVISWTPANWITVILMVAIGFTIIGVVTKVVQQKRAATAAA